MNNDLYLFSMYSIHKRKPPYRKPAIIDPNKNKNNNKNEQHIDVETTPKINMDEYFEKLLKYKDNIMEFTKGCFHYPIRGGFPIHKSESESLENHMNETFLHFSVACIEYFEENREPFIEESDDDSLLFDPFTTMKKSDSVLNVFFTSLKKQKCPHT